MIPETCILNNKHKLYATLRHECNASPGKDESGCNECPYYKERQNRIMGQYSTIMAPRNLNHTHNAEKWEEWLTMAYNGSSASSGSLLANVGNQFNTPHYNHNYTPTPKEEVLKEEPKTSFLKKISKVIKNYF